MFASVCRFLSDAIISFSFKLACCSFQRGVSEDRTEARAVFLPTVTARLSVISKRRAGGKEKRGKRGKSRFVFRSWRLTFLGLKTADTCQACESAPRCRVSEQKRSSSRDLRGSWKKPWRETCRGGKQQAPRRSCRYGSSPSSFALLHICIFSLGYFFVLRYFQSNAERACVCVCVCERECAKWSGIIHCSFT